MSEIQSRLLATQEAIAESEARLSQAWNNLARSARPEAAVERQVAKSPHAFWLGAFVVGLTLGCLHGGSRRLLS